MTTQEKIEVGDVWAYDTFRICIDEITEKHVIYWKNGELDVVPLKEIVLDRYTLIERNGKPVNQEKQTGA